MKQTESQYNEIEAQELNEPTGQRREIIYI